MGNHSLPTKAAFTAINFHSAKKSFIFFCFNHLTSMKILLALCLVTIAASAISARNVRRALKSGKMVTVRQSQFRGSAKCQDDADCGRNFFCEDGHYCSAYYTGCNSDNPFEPMVPCPDGHFCNQRSGMCNNCATDHDCAAQGYEGKFCVKGICHGFKVYMKLMHLTTAPAGTN